MTVPPQTALDESAPARAAQCRGVTWRAVMLSLALAVFFGYFIPVVDYKFFNTFLGATHLPPGAIAALGFLLLVVNPLLRLFSRRGQLSRNEALTVYLSCLFSTLVPGIGGNNYWVSFIIGTFYYSTRENRWFDFLKGLPPWFSPALNADGTYNQALVEAWYLGSSKAIPWGAWIVPLLAWSAFFLAAFTMMGCLSVMLCAQWGQREALAFPLLKLPLALTENLETNRENTSPGFFSNPLMWIGFGLAAFVQLTNGLNLYFPDVPAISTNLNTAPLLSEAPWDQIGGIRIRIFPVAVGVAFLLSSEISLSFWFFYLLLKWQFIGAYLTGFPPNTLPRMTGTGSPLFIGFQEVGANFVYVALVLWTAREHLRYIARRAFRRIPATEAEKSEALSYPVAFWGFGISFAFMVGWGVLAGMSFGLSLALWTFYLVIALVLSRVVAESGLLFVHHTWMPLGALSHLIGVGPGTALSSANGLVPAAFMEGAAIEDFRGSLMPSFVQSFKLVSDRQIAAKPFLGLIAAVIFIGMFIGFQMNVRLGYQNGGLGLQSWMSHWGPNMVGSNINNLLTKTGSGEALAWIWMTFGGLFTFALMFARARLAWFPLHPLGYLMSFTLPLSHLWFSIFVGWGCKTLLNKYGGPEAVRRTTPLFLGLALGDVAMMLFWILVDGWTGRTGHQLMPG